MCRGEIPKARIWLSSCNWDAKLPSLWTSGMRALSPVVPEWVIFEGIFPRTDRI